MKYSLRFATYFHTTSLIHNYLLPNNPCNYLTLILFNGYYELKASNLYISKIHRVNSNYIKFRLTLVYKYT